MVLRISAVEVSRDQLRVWAGFFFFFLLLFFFIFRDTKNNRCVFILFRSLYAHLPYHKTILQRLPLLAVITVAPAVKYSFVSKGMQTRRTGQHKAKLTLSPRLHVKPLITVITAIRHPVRTCATHRFYDSRCSHFR